MSNSPVRLPTEAELKRWERAESVYHHQNSSFLRLIRAYRELLRVGDELRNHAANFDDVIHEFTLTGKADLGPSQNAVAEWDALMQSREEEAKESLKPETTES